MKKLLGTALSGLLVLGLILGGIGCAGEEATPTPTAGVSPTATVEYIKMGSSAPLTGLVAYMGDSLQKTIDLVIEEFNEAGGIVIDGVRYLIDMIWYDDRYDPIQGYTNVEKLVYQDEVKYLVGLFSAPLLGSSETINENKILTTASFVGGEEVISPERPYVFKPYMSPVDRAYPDMRYLTDNYAVKRFAILNMDSTSGRLNTGMYERACEELGVETFALYFPIGTTDYYPMLTKLLNWNPDLLFVGPVMLAQARELGYTGMVTGTLAAVDVGDVIEAAGAEDAEGYYFSSVFDWRASPETIDFHDRYVAKYGSYDEMALSWVGHVEAVIQGIKKAQSVDPTDVMHALDAMAEAGEPIHLPIGDCYWAGAARYGGLMHQLAMPLHVMDIHNGEARLLDVLPASTEDDILPLE